jgi:hypothetical protein
MAHQRIAYGIQQTSAGWLWEVSLDGEALLRGTCETGAGARLAALSACMEIIHDSHCDGGVKSHGDHRA